MVLGISLGTRTLGVAVLQGKELVEWRTLIFKGKWSEQKCTAIVNRLRKIIQSNKITRIALKLPPSTHHSSGMKMLLESIAAHTRAYSIGLYTFTIADIKNHHGSTITNKEALQQQVFSMYPELASEYHKERGNRNKYYSKLFEAIGAALLLQHNP